MRRSTRVKTEPVDPAHEEPKPKSRKKKNEEEPGSSVSSPKKLTSIKTEPAEQPTTPKTSKRARKNDDEPTSSSSRSGKGTRTEPSQESPVEKSPKSAGRQGRPSTGAGKKFGVPINDAQDRKDLSEFKKAKDPKDILTVYVTEQTLLKFLGGAMRASGNGRLDCPGCSKNYTTHSGMAYHIQRCKESVIVWEAVHDSIVYSDLKDRPWMWVNAKPNAKKEMASAALKESKGSVECVRGAECGADPFTTVAALIAHLDQCCVPTYNQFRGKTKEFRALEKKTKATLIRLAMSANGGQLPCLECGKIFGHKYGLAYHLDRCGFNADNADQIPWKCYRCGFEGTIGDRDAHLDACYVPASEAVKPKKDRRTVDDLDMDELNNRRRRSEGVSMASGKIPMRSSLTRITSKGLKRFKFRKSEAMQHNITITADLEKYRTAVSAAVEQHKQTHQSAPLCEMLQRRVDAQARPWTSVEEGVYVEALREKKSIGLRQRTLEHFAQSEGKVNSNNKRTTFPPVVEHLSMPATELTRIGAFTAENFDSACSPSVSIGYAGGPIAATHLAPTPLSETSECLAVLTFPSDEQLVDATTGKADWRATDAYIQMWKVEKSREAKEKKNSDDVRDVTRCELSMWFMLRIEGRGLALAANWMPRSSTDPDVVGCLAVAMSEGTVVVYCIRKDSVPEGGEEGGVVVVAPPPVIVLKAPTLDEVNAMRRKQRAERAGPTSTILGSIDERLTRSARAQLDTPTTAESEGVQENSAVAATADVIEMKPITGFETSAEEEPSTESSQEVVPPPAPVVPETSVKKTKAQQKKELIKMRLAKPEYGPPPQPPVIAVSWSPFGECSTIAAVDAAGTVIVWNLDENLVVAQPVEGGEGEAREALKPFRVFADLSWHSPAINVGWMDTELLGVSFAERLVRVLDISTGYCQLEENTVRTAGKSLAAYGPCFEGLFIFQSEFYTATEAPETAVVYLAYGAEKDGYFVVPLTNRHGLMVWAVGVSSSGVIGTAGADGRVQLSMNGKIVPRGCVQDLSVNLHTDPILLIRNRVTEPRPGDEGDANEGTSGAKKENPPPPAVYASHEDVTNNMWLDVVCEDADTISGPALPQGLLDSRVESLNAITLSAVSPASPLDHVVVTGGQAGLLFARSCHIEEKGLGSVSWMNLKKWSNPSSKESTPRPKSRNSKERTPKE